MPNVQMHPDGAGLTTKVNGRTYTAVAGAPQVVPDFDANVLAANGWIAVGNVGGLSTAGTTAQRPTSPKKGDSHVDTTVGAMIIWDGRTWRHATTGAAV